MNISLFIFVLGDSNMAFFQDFVWLKTANGSSEYDLPMAVKVLSKSGSKIKVRDDDGKEFTINADQVLKPLHATSIAGVEDMITLGELQEYSILRNLHIRYNQQLIYVSIFCS